MTLINLGSTNLNPDGSTTVYGADGNAIETIGLDGVTLFGDPLTNAGEAAVPIWYAPAESSGYFSNILDAPGSFMTVVDGVAVFKMYLAMATLPDATLQAFFAYLTANNIKLAVEAGPLVADVGQPGYGIESFATPGAMVAMMDKIQADGGNVSYVAWDEPLYYGNESTGIYTVSQLATQVAAASSAVEAIFPNVQIGDVEPVGSTTSDPANLQAWFTAYAAASGTPFTFFQADVQYWVPGWQADLANVITTVHANAMTIGVVIEGLSSTPTDDAWDAQAVANADQILSTPALRPDYLVLQSWQPIPSEVSDPTIAGTLASAEADIAASENVALSVPATASYDADGFLQSVAWTGGYTAIQTASAVEFLSPTGAVVYQADLVDVETFAFDPETGTVSLDVQVLTSAPGAVPVWGTDAYSVSVGASGFDFGTPVTASGSLTLGLTAASETGTAGSDITDLTTPSFTGTAPAGAVVSVQVDGIASGTATASGAGTWSYTLPTALSDGAHAVAAAYTDAVTGDVVQEFSEVTVDTATPTTPTLTLAPGSDTGYAGDDITDVAQPVFTGVADPYDTVTLAIGGATVATVRADGSGDWTYDLNSALAVGSYTVTATATNAAGTASAAATMALTIDTPTEEAANTSPDPLFDTEWYLQTYPQAASANESAYTQFSTVGWTEGYSPDPFFSTSYYLNEYPAIAAAGIDPLMQFEVAGWQDNLNPSATFDTPVYVLDNPGIPAGEDPLLYFIQSQEYSDAVVTAAANSTLSVALLHDTGASSTDNLTNDPTLAITADPGATVTVALGSATPYSFTLGSTGSWNMAYAAASLADGTYTATVTETELDGPTSTATLTFTLDRTAPVVTTAAIATGLAAGDALAAGNTATITLTLSEAVTVTGAPTLSLSDGGTASYVSGSGTDALTFKTTIAAGQSTTALAVTGLNLPGAATVTDDVGNTANLATTLPGSVVVETALPSSGANVAFGSGATITMPSEVNAYTVTLAGTSAVSAPTLVDAASAFGGQFELLVAGSGASAGFGTLTTTGTAINQGVILTEPGASGGAATLSITLGGTLINSGTIEAEAGSTIDITGTAGTELLNAGSLIDDGMMFIGPAVVGTGIVDVGVTGGAGKIEFGGTVAGGQSIVFNAGTVTVDSASSFYATIEDFTKADSIVLKGVNVTSDSYSGGVLMLNAGKLGALHFQPPSGTTFTTGSFVLSHSGGSTTITTH